MRVGLTGGVASGKSTVTALLREQGVPVIDADALAREVVEPGTPGLARVVQEFGEAVLAPDGTLDRAALGRLVFADEAARRRLEAIVHPLVYQRIAELEADLEPGGLVVHDIPLLAENDRAGDFDAVVVVDAPEEVQLQRMVEDRGWSESDARARIAAQAGRERRRAMATYVIDNTGTHEDLRSSVAEVLVGLRDREQEGRAPG